MILQAIKVNWGSCSKRSVVGWAHGAAFAASIKIVFSLHAALSSEGRGGEGAEKLILIEVLLSHFNDLYGFDRCHDLRLNDPFLFLERGVSKLHLMTQTFFTAPL